MALTLGTNCGFVATAPTEDPSGGSTSQIDAYARALQHTTPVAANIITEIGFWCDPDYWPNATTCEVGIYADNGSDTPTTRLHVATYSKAYGTGWFKKDALAFTVTGNTKYWIAVQLDSASGISTDTAAAGSGNAKASGYGATSLADPFSVGSSPNRLLAFYAVWGTVSTGPSIPVLMNQYRQRRN